MFWLCIGDTTGRGVPRLSISQLAAFTGKDRRTITTRLEALDYIEGEDNAHLYDTERAFELIYLGNGEGGPISLEQAKKEKELAAAENLRIRNEELRRTRIPRHIISEILDAALQAFAATLKTARGKKLTVELINTLLGKLRNVKLPLEW